MVKRSTRKIIKRRNKKTIKKKIVKKDIQPNQNLRETIISNNPQLQSNISLRTALMNRLSGSTMPGINIGTGTNNNQKTLGDIYASRQKLENETTITKSDLEKEQKKNAKIQKELNDKKRELEREIAEKKALNDKYEQQATEAINKHNEIETYKRKIGENIKKVLKNQSDVDLYEKRDENESLEHNLIELKIKQQEQLNEIEKNRVYQKNKLLQTENDERNARIAANDALLKSDEIQKSLKKREELIKENEKLKYEEEITTNLLARKMELEKNKFMREQQLTAEEMKTIQNQYANEIKKLNVEIAKEEIASEPIKTYINKVSYLRKIHEQKEQEALEAKINRTEWERKRTAMGVKKAIKKNPKTGENEEVDEYDYNTGDIIDENKKITTDIKNKAHHEILGEKARREYEIRQKTLELQYKKMEDDEKNKLLRKDESLNKKVLESVIASDNQIENAQQELTFMQVEQDKKDKLNKLQELFDKQDANYKISENMYNQKYPYNSLYETAQKSIEAMNMMTADYIAKNSLAKEIFDTLHVHYPNDELGMMKLYMDERMGGLTYDGKNFDNFTLNDLKKIAKEIKPYIMEIKKNYPQYADENPPPLTDLYTQ